MLHIAMFFHLCLLSLWSVKIGEFSKSLRSSVGKSEVKSFFWCAHIR